MAFCNVEWFAKSNVFLILGNFKNNFKNKINRPNLQSYYNDQRLVNLF